MIHARRTRARNVPQEPQLNEFKKPTLNSSMGFAVSQASVAGAVFNANARFPIPITNRAVTVMGNVFTNCPLDECNIRTAERSGFLYRHLFYITLAKYSRVSIPRTFERKNHVLY